MVSQDRVTPVWLPGGNSGGEAADSAAVAKAPLRETRALGNAVRN